MDFARLVLFLHIQFIDNSAMRSAFPNIDSPPPPAARHYHPTLSIWLSVDPMSDKYPSTSPYTYCANNPVKLKDPDGTHIEVVENDNGTYTVVNGSINKDRNIYIVDNEGKRTGKVLGKMLTNYSFFYDEGSVAQGAIINPDDNRGRDFLSKMENDPINLYNYIFDKEKGGRSYGEMDFKIKKSPMLCIKT